MSTPAPQQGKKWQSLLDQGWHQGALFAGPGLSFNYNLLGSAGTFEATGRNVKSREQLVVATQDCDIVSENEPYIEAIVCKPESSAFCDKISDNSARYFAVDPANCLVAKASLRIHIDKGALSMLTPKAWPASAERRERFASWLARRYDRPPFPDVLVKAFVNPLQQVLEWMDDSVHGAALHRVTKEWRLSAPTSDDPPFDVGLLLLLDTNSLSEVEADALGIIEEQLRSVLDPAVIKLHPVIRMATPDDLSVREYWTTFPIYAEYLSYQGDDAVGALPLPRL